jgi:hypothetical protein
MFLLSIVGDDIVVACTQKPARAEPFRGSFFAGLNAAARFGGSQAMDFCNCNSAFWAVQNAEFQGRRPILPQLSCGN